MNHKCLLTRFIKANSIERQASVIKFPIKYLLKSCPFSCNSVSMATHLISIKD